MKLHILPLVIVALLCTACTNHQTLTPEIKFVGVAEGDLETDIGTLEFSDQFDPSDRELIGVVALENVMDGTQVMASWFSPDDRRPPFGRRVIDIQSGATIARFTIANTINWDADAYMFTVDIRTDQGEGNEPLTAKGSVRYFIGMTDSQIQTYFEDYAEWERREEEKTSALRAEEEYEQGLLRTAAEAFGTNEDDSNAILALRSDITGNDEDEYIFLDTAGQPPFEASTNSAILLSHPVNQFAILTAESKVILSMTQESRSRTLKNTEGPIGDLMTRKGPVTVTLLPSSTVSLAWEEGNEQCAADLALEDGIFVERKRECR